MSREVHIVFDGPPEHQSGRFVEVEDADGRGMRLGEWKRYGDYWHLVFDACIPPCKQPSVCGICTHPIEECPFLEDRCAKDAQVICQVCFEYMHREIVTVAGPSLDLAKFNPAMSIFGRRLYWAVRRVS